MSEAWQWDGTELMHDTPDWVAENTEPTWSSLSLAGFTGGITAFTSFGKARLRKGDWLIRHEGEIHAVKDAVYVALTSGNQKSEK
jgi:hypothetical protein